jgi:uncharacterized membrane protein YeaQ/YmgE (transglycosylase-associated protein family)
MLIVAWILFGLIPGFLAVAFIDRKREKVRVVSTNVESLNKNKY